MMEETSIRQIRAGEIVRMGTEERKRRQEEKLAYILVQGARMKVEADLDRTIQMK